MGERTVKRAYPADTECQVLKNKAQTDLSNRSAHPAADALHHTDSTLSYSVPRVPTEAEPALSTGAQGLENSLQLIQSTVTIQTRPGLEDSTKAQLIHVRGLCRYKRW